MNTIAISSFRFVLVVLGAFTSMSACTKENAQIHNPYALYKFPLKHSFIALSPLPARVDMEADLNQITQAEITNVLTLVSNEELEKYKVPTLLTRYNEMGLELMHSPIPDYGLPETEQVKAILTWLHKKIKSKENVLIHCVGGL